MNRAKTKLAFKGIAAGFINNLVAIVLPFVVRTVMIYTIGIEYIGLNSVFSSILLILSFAELGFDSVIVYSMYRPIAEHDNEKLCALLNLYKKIYRIVGLIILIVALSIMPFIRYFINGSYPEDINLYILYGIYLFNTVIGYWLFTYKRSLLSAHQMYYVSSNISTITNVFVAIGQLLILFLVKNFYFYIIFLPIGTIISNIVVAFYTKKAFPNIKPYGSVDKETAKDIRKNVLSGIGHKLGPTATTSVDNLVVSSFAGLVLASAYSNYNYIVTSVTAFASLIFGSFVAGIGNSIVTESVDKNYEDFKFFTFVNCVVVGWSAICILCLCQSFMWLWVGEKNGSEYMYSIVAVVLLSFMYYVQQIRAVVTSYKTAAGMWYADRFKPYVAVAANAILDIVLFPYLGVIGIILSTIIARALIGIPWETNALFKNYFKKPQLPYYLMILKYTIVTSIIGVGCYFIVDLIPCTSWLLFLVKSIACFSLAGVLFLIVYIREPYMRKIYRYIFKQKRADVS